MLEVLGFSSITIELFLKAVTSRTSSELFAVKQEKGNSIELSVPIKLNRICDAV